MSDAGLENSTSVLAQVDPPDSIVRRNNAKFAPICMTGRLSQLERQPPKRDNFVLGAGATVGRPARKPAVAMTKEEERDLREQLARLLEEHRDLDAAILALQDAPGSDLLQIQRLKKRKLYLRDRISFIEDQLTPDIIA
jgi:hypothetical protein